MTESLNPDLDGSTCLISNCLHVADVVGTAGLTLPAIVGHPGDHLQIDLPLCVNHAHLLRMGVERCELDSRI